MNMVLRKIKWIFESWKAGSPYIIIFNFHRIGSHQHRTFFDRLHTLSSREFRVLLLLLRTIFRMIPLAQLTQKVKPGLRPYVILTFDDVSRSFMTHALPLLEKYCLPVSIFPCTHLTNYGFGWRDLVYYILDHSELESEVAERISIEMGSKESERMRALGFYSWTKRPEINTKWLEQKVLLPILDRKMNDIRSLVNQHQPYLNWDDLRKLTNHPLITIGSHGSSHHDYRSLTNQQIQTDVNEAHEIFKHELGIFPKYFALPFGSLDQRVLLTLDKLLPKLGYEAACWSDGPYGNVMASTTLVPHLFRIHTPHRVDQTIRSGVRALSRPIFTPITLLKKTHLEGETIVDTKITEDEYRHIHLLILPMKTHHQSKEYYEYLFKTNPYVDLGMPIHLGIRHDGNLEAIASLFWLRFCFKGIFVKGAYFSGWWRLPEVHSPNGTWPLLANAQSISNILGAYSASPYSARLFAKAGWGQIDVTRFEGMLKTISLKHNYHIFESYPAQLDETFASFKSSVDFSVYRDRTYYMWRFEQYPLLKYNYLVDANFPPTWFAVVGHKAGDVYVSDLLALPFGEEEAWLRLLSAVKNYAKEVSGQKIIIETNHRTLKELIRIQGLRPTLNYSNFYYLAPNLKNQFDFDWNRIFVTHETGATGDVLPR